MKKITAENSERAPHSGRQAESLIILLHGYGSSGNDLLGLVPMFAPQFPHAHFISPNALEGFESAPAGYQWFSLREYSEAALLRGCQQAAPPLNAFLDEQLARFGLNDDRLALVGFSQGTMMSLYVSLRRKNPCAGVIGFSGALLGVEGIVSKPPICLIHGENDPVVPFAALHAAETTLKSQHVPVQAFPRPQLGHSIDYEGLAIASGFLKSKLG